MIIFLPRLAVQIILSQPDGRTCLERVKLLKPNETGREAGIREGSGKRMTVFAIFFMVFVILGLIGIERNQRRRLDNDAAIIERLDRIAEELRNGRKGE
ncbi:hypothetical protein [Paenibacillus sp. GCM10023250]|uniref:hypothetical protein n=1 Tax=Paenibacillus sp. GCM10023250 TaxID=3252648 RepID=UPI0036D2C2AF